MASCSKKSSQDKPISQASLVTWLGFLCLLPIQFYRYFISPMLGPKCRFEPSCSHYAELAIKQHGPFTGIYLAVKRILKCHPWHPGGYDPVPKTEKSPQEH